MTKLHRNQRYYQQDIFQAVLFIGILALTYAVYSPGLEGPFLFDDFANINQLGNYGGVRDWDSFRLFVFGGTAGPTGRPLALVSFLLNDIDWPSNPQSFKHTNLMLHLLTGTVLFGLSRTLLKLDKSMSPGQVGMVALFVAGAWLLHPLLVSTTLYIVQRMAILSTLFVLLGLWGYVHGRALLQQHTRKGYLWISISLILCTLLATLSKENGVLLLPLALLVEQLILKHQLSKHPDIRWSILFLWLPVILITLYIMSIGWNNAGFGQRPFTVSERLLTEARILLDYLRWWFIPGTNSPGLLTQDFPISKGVLAPSSTLYALIFIVGTIVVSILIRKNYYYLSLAILFFFIAHSMEAGPIALELYFEHRNYLPAVFLALPIGVRLSQIEKKSRLVGFAGVAILVGLALITYQRAVNWSDIARLAFHWADIHPYSQRAQRNAAQVAEKIDRPELAIQILRNALEKQPDNFPIKIHLLMLHCQYLEVHESEINSLIDAAGRLPFNFKASKLVESLVNLGPTDQCRGISAAHIEKLLQTLLTNPNAVNHAGPQRQIHHFLGKLALYKGDGATAAMEFKKSQQIFPDTDVGMLQTSLLATNQHFVEALAHLELVEQLQSRSIKNKRSIGSLNYAEEIKRMRKYLLDDINTLKAHENQQR